MKKYFFLCTLMFISTICSAEDVYLKDGRIMKGTITGHTSYYIILGSSETWAKIYRSEVEKVVADKKNESLKKNNFEINFNIKGIFGYDDYSKNNQDDWTNMGGFGTEIQLISKTINFGVGFDSTRSDFMYKNTDRISRANFQTKAYFNPRGIFSPWLGVGEQEYNISEIAYYTTYPYNSYYIYKSGKLNTLSLGIDINLLKNAVISAEYKYTGSTFGDVSNIVKGDQFLITLGLKINLLSINENSLLNK